MLRTILAAISGSLLVGFATAAPVPKPSPPDTFLVDHIGLHLLRADGKEKKIVEGSSNIGALSPDGQWLASVEYDREKQWSNLIVARHSTPGDPVTIPLLFGEVGNGCGIVWSADGKRILIGENGPGKDGKLKYAFRILGLESKTLTELELPPDCWVTGWSPDGKRFLAYLSIDNTTRIGWIAADGTGKPEFITAADEVAYDGRLSADGKRLLCLIGPPKATPGQMRLTSIDLKTQRRVVIDEPGITHGYSWSPDGTMVAYTWQCPPGERGEATDRETLLITCTAEGKDRKIVTSRKQKLTSAKDRPEAIVFFFRVVDWR